MARLETSANVAIREHLGQILASKSFAGSPRLRKFLSFVVERTLNGESEHIKEFLIAIEVYERGSDYDPQIDSTVRVEAGRLRAKLREYYEGIGGASAIRIELPKGSYVPTFHIPTALVAIPEEPNVRNHRRYFAFCGALTVLLVGIFSSTRVPAKHKLDDPELVEQYLRADRLFRQPALKSGWSGKVTPHVAEAIAMFEGITRGAPTFTKAWVRLAEAHEWAYELDKAHPRERLYVAKTALVRAIRNDPNCAEAHARLASIYFHGLGDVDHAEASVKRALALNPRDLRSQTRYASLLRIRGRGEEALTNINRALALDSTASVLWAQQSLVKYDAGRYDDALAAADHALTIDPEGNQLNQGLLALWVRGLSLYRLGSNKGSGSLPCKALESGPKDGWNHPALGYLLAQTGRGDEAREILAELTMQHEKGKPVCYAIALVLVGLDEKEEALNWLERGAASSDTSMAFIHLDKRFETLRAHARFQRLSRKAAA